MCYTFYLGKHKNKVEGHIQIQGTLRTALSISFHQTGLHSYVPSNRNKHVLKIDCECLSQAV